eukprot:552402-Prorocentrum_minimum.AAC.1
MGECKCNPPINSCKTCLLSFESNPTTLESNPTTLESDPVTLESDPAPFESDHGAYVALRRRTSSRLDCHARATAAATQSSTAGTSSMDRLSTARRDRRGGISAAAASSFSSSLGTPANVTGGGSEGGQKG